MSFVLPPLTTPVGPAPVRTGTACTVRGVLRWALVLIAVGVVSAAWAAHSLWRRADQLLRNELERQIALRVPTWDISFANAHADWNGTVRITDLVVRGTRSSEPLLELPEVLLEVDVDLLLEHQRVMVHKVRLRDGLIRARRDAQGRWDWQELAPPRPGDIAPPDVIIENASIVARFDHSEDWPESEFRCGKINGRAEPDSRHSYKATAEGDVQRVGHVNLKSEFDLAHRVWNVEGRCGQVDLEGLLRDLVGVSPAARQRVAALTEATRLAQHRRPLQLASLETQPVEPPAADPTRESVLSGLGLQADMSLDFQASVQQAGEAPVYSLSADIRDGQLTNRMLPLALYGLKGHVLFNNDRLQVKTLTAANGDSQILIDGEWAFHGAVPTRRFVCRASELELGPELRDYLPAPLQMRYDQLRPSGRFNLDMEYDAAELVPLKLRQFAVANGSLIHEQFPIPLIGVEGRIKQRGDMLELHFQGWANGRRVTLDGDCQGLAPGAAAHFVIDVDELPIDATFLQAFAYSRLEKVQKLSPLLDELTPSGVADWRVELVRNAGLGEPFHLARLHGSVRNGSMRYRRFPLPVADVRGEIDYDAGLDASWNLRNWTGQHASTQLSGQGTYLAGGSPSELDLQLTALSVAIDRDLQEACVAASPALQTVWRELEPSGLLDLSNFRILWSHGIPVEIELPSIQIHDARITPRAVPYSWDRLNGAARWSGRRLVIRTLQGWHQDAYLNINGVDPGGDLQEPMAFFEQSAGQPSGWRLHLADVEIRKLAVDDELRGSLPGVVRLVAAQIAPSHSLDVKFGLDLKGFDQSQLITAHWRMNAGISGGNLTLGLPIQNAHGSVEITDGRYDGKNVYIVGAVRLDEATILSLPMRDLHGPFRIHEGQVSVGAPAWVDLPAPPVTSPHADQSFQGTLYGGRVLLDGSADLAGGDLEPPSYAVDVRLRNAKLEEWAHVNRPHERLRGDVDGEVTLHGRGSDGTSIQGKGWIQIAPAELYDLPVLAKIFQLIQFQPPEKKAFESALGEFELHDGLFDFSQIVLYGNTISLVGKGTVAFAGPAAQTVDIRLYTMVTNRLPLVGWVVEGLGRKWVEVHVVGTLSSPQTVTQARIPLLPDAIQGLMKALERGQPPQPARRSAAR